MRFLAEMGVSMSTVASLPEAGHDAVHLREEEFLRMADSDILDKAPLENRVADLRFGFRRPVRGLRRKTSKRATT